MTILFFMCAFCHLLHGNFFIHSLILIYLFPSPSLVASYTARSAFIYSIDVRVRACVYCNILFKYFLCTFLDPRGLNLPNVFREIRGYTQSLMNSERERQVSGGRSLISVGIDLTGIGGDSIQTGAHPVIHRIQQEPRRIINHRYV